MINKNQPISEDILTVKDGVTHPRFYLLAFMMFNGVFFGTYIASVYKSIDVDILSDHILTVAGAIGSVCNGGSRLFWAALMDKFGFKKVYYFLLAIQLVVSAMMYYVRNNASLYVLCVAIAFLCEGG